MRLEHINIKKSLLLLFVSLLGVSCNNAKVSGRLKYDPEPAHIEEVTTLQENRVLISKIDNLAFAGDTAFFVVTDNKIVQYNWLGEQTAVIDRRGAGPEEYINIDKISTGEKCIYVWCYSTLRLLKYDTTGQFLGVVAQPEASIKGFGVDEESKTVCFYHPRGGGKIAALYDIQTGKMQPFDSMEFGEEDKLLSVGNANPGVVFASGKLLFAPYSSQEVYELDLKTGVFSQSETKGPNDDAFGVEPVSDAPSLINGFSPKLAHYLDENGSTIGIYEGEKGLIMVSLVGKIEWDSSFQKIEHNDRTCRIYFQDNESENGWKAMDMPLPLDLTPRFWAHDGQLFTLLVNTEGTSSTYTLCKVNN